MTESRMIPASEKSPAVSVVAPVYNTAIFLRQCVTSVLAQTFSDYELILVDDGSTDESGSICDELATTDPRIRVIHRRNGGLSAARNTGIEASRGDFITFLDSDDALHPDYLSTLFNMRRTTGADICCVGYRKFHSTGEKSDPEPDILNPNPEKFNIRSGREALLGMLYQTAPPECSAWGKLYPRDFFNEIRFREGILYEDLDIAYLLMLKAGKVAVCDLPLYLYRQNETSILHTFNEKRADVLDVTERMERYFTTESPDRELMHAARHRRLSAAFNIMGLCAANGRHGELPARCWNIIRCLRREVALNGRSRIKNRIGALLSYIGGRRLITLLSKRVYGR